MRRVLDITISAVALLVLLPLLIVIAVLVVVSSKGGALYGGMRVGRNGRLFRMWKFRTMMRDADRLGSGVPTQADPRITRIGHSLRKTKLDELPQFWNVLMGDMTLVGPRPEVMDALALYSPEQREILKHKPGLTSPGQIFYATNLEPLIPDGVDTSRFYVDQLLDHKLKIDFEYLARQTFLSDCRVVLDTAKYVLRPFVVHCGQQSQTPKPIHK